MIIILYFMQKVLIKLIILLAGMMPCISVFGQDEEINYHKYKKEIGIDFQSILSGGGSLGTALILKIRKPDKGLISVNEKTAYRFRLILNGDIPIEQVNYDLYPGNPLFFVNNEYNAFNGGFSVGLERQINRKRLQYSYGLDLGYLYSDRQYVNYRRISSIQSGKTEDIRNVETYKIHTPSLTPFFGFKYFILPEISVSVESGLSFYYNLINSQVTEQILPDQEVETILMSKGNEVGFDFDYLRALNLSYYF